MKIFGKRIALLGVIFCMMLAMLGCGKQNVDAGKTEAATSAGNLKVRVLNVGQGDSILIETGEQTVLLDTSDIDERDKLRAELKKANVKKIDKLILTHPHADHIGGVEILLDAFEVKDIYYNGMPSTSKIYLGYRKQAKAKNIPNHKLGAGESLDLGGGVKFDVYYPTAALVAAGNEKGYKHDPNNESIVGMLVYGDFRMLMTGDAEKIVEKALLQRGVALKCNVLKAPHHGSKTSSSAEFLKAAAPEAVVISCGAGNDYGHPHEAVMKRYKAGNMKIFQTDKNGTITITSDGKGYNIEEETK